MKLQLLFGVILLCIGSETEAAECETGWSVFKDEKCIKVFEDTPMVNYYEANKFCESQGNSASPSTLVTVQEFDMQIFLASLTTEIFESIWLGGKYNSSTSQFTWIDGNSLNYTNWGYGFPRNVTNLEVCIKFRPVKARLEGQWEDAVCQQKGLIMCQRTLTWTLEDATKEIIKIRKEFQNQLDKLNNELEVVRSQVVPIGSIYMEYFDQQSPAKLWPALQWQDVTNSYAGMFFRALGGESANWGESQPGCAPRLKEMQYSESSVDNSMDNVHFAENGWSEKGKAGIMFRSGSAKQENVRFFTEGCEVRPKNQAVRLWKRIA